jgi:hypothetical protein
VVDKNDLTNFTNQEVDNYVSSGDEDRKSELYVYNGKNGGKKIFILNIYDKMSFFL